MASYEGPFLSAAVLCEKVLEEKDGVKSAIRIVDRITHNVFGPNPPSIMEPFEYDMTLFVRFKSGSSRGVYPLKLSLISPSGESHTQTLNINFEGEEDRGIDVIAPMHVRFEVQGIYWIEIFLKGDFVTRVPMRVIYIPQIIPQMPAKPEGPG